MVMVKIWFADLQPVPTLSDTTLRGALRRFLRVEEGRAGQTALSHLCQVLQSFYLPSFGNLTSFSVLLFESEMFWLVRTGVRRVLTNRTEFGICFVLFFTRVGPGSLNQVADSNTTCSWPKIQKHLQLKTKCNHCSALIQCWGSVTFWCG